MDASIRRFKTQKLYMRASAAIRWIISRNGLLKGHRPTQQHVEGLQHISATFRSVSIFPKLQASTQMLILSQELSQMSDSHVEYALRYADSSQGKWLAEDPSLAVLTMMTNRR